MEEVKQSVPTPASTNAMPSMSEVRSYPGMPQAPTGLSERMQAQKPKGSKKKLVLGIVSVFILVILGVGGYWYYAQGQAMLMTRQMSWPWGNSEKNFKTTGSYTGTFKVHRVEQKKEETINPTSTNSASADLYYGVNDLLESGISVSESDVLADFNEKDMESSFHVDVVANNYDNGSEGDFNLSINSAQLLKSSGNFSYKVIFEAGKTQLYLMLKNIDEETKESVSTFFDLESLLNKWIDLAGGLDMIGQEEDQKQNKDLFNQKTLEFLEKLRVSDVLVIKDMHESKDTAAGTLKKINYHIKAGKTLALMEMANADYPEWQDYIKKLKEDPKLLEQIEKSLDNTDINLWLGSKDNVVYGLELVNNQFEATNYSEEYISTFTISVMFEVIAAQAVTAPTDAVSLEELMSPMFQMGRQMDPNADTDNDGLTTAMEIYYGSETGNADTDYDGFNDGQEVFNGFDPIGSGKLSKPLYSDYIKSNFKDQCLLVNGVWKDDDLGICQCPSGHSANQTEYLEDESLGGSICNSHATHCIMGGGKWMVPDREEEMYCNKIQGTQTAMECVEDKKCEWDSSMWPNDTGVYKNCISQADYCECPGGEKVGIDKINLQFNCLNSKS